MLIEKKNNFCAWSDVLGFANPFEADEWTFSENSQQNIETLICIDSILKESIVENEKCLFLNDGVSRIYDIKYDFDHKIGASIDNPFLLLRWFNQILIYHFTVNEFLKPRLPGIRTVISFGERLNIAEEFLTADKVNHFYKNILFSDESKGEIALYNPKEFQLNLAFSKAYFIESAGSKAGICGSNLFIDSQVLEVLLNFFNQFGCAMEDKFIEEIYEDGFGFILSETLFKSEIDHFDGFLFLSIFANDKNGSQKILELILSEEPIKFSKRGLLTDIYVLKYYRIGLNHKLRDSNNLCSMMTEYHDFENYSLIKQLPTKTI